MKSEEFIKYIYLKVVKRNVAIHPIGESEDGNGTKMAYEYEYDKSDDKMTVPVQGFESANFAKKISTELFDGNLSSLCPIQCGISRVSGLGLAWA
jgi:hypothetical protein